MQESWRPVKGYEGLYEISNRGRVKSLKRIVKRGNHTLQIPETILKIHINRWGYPHCSLNKNGKSKTHTIHRLVASAFIDKSHEGLEVNHIDGNKENNSVENLEWVTRTENIRHAFSNNLMVRHKGYKNGSAILDDEKVKEIKRHILEGKMYSREIARKYGVSLTCITHIKTNNTWTHIPWPKIKTVRGKRYLREKSVAEIKSLLLNSKLSVKEIAKRYSVSPSAIYNIKYDRVWKHVEPLPKEEVII